MYWIREIAGWALLVLGLWLFYVSYFVLLRNGNIVIRTDGANGHRRFPRRHPSIESGGRRAGVPTTSGRIPPETHATGGATGPARPTVAGRRWCRAAVASVKSMREIWSVN